MQKTENVLLTMIHDFFLIYLPNRRKCSPHTIQAYRTAVEQLVDATVPDSFDDDTLKRLYKEHQR